MRGLRLKGPIPSPSWSVELSPQHRTIVSVRTTQVLRRLALTDVTTGRAETGTSALVGPTPVVTTVAAAVRSEPSRPLTVVGSERWLVVASPICR